MNDNGKNDNFISKEVSIAEIQTLLENGYEVEVDSPDGYVQVSDFVNKGLFQEYVLKLQEAPFDIVRCNGKHLFQTSVGWASAEQLEYISEFSVLTKNGYKKAKVSTTGEMIPIVDIQVEHENHRYYTNGVSSHNTGVGKSLFMCHMASACLLLGYDVLYITMEMSEEKIAQRIDANLLDIPINKIEEIPRDLFTSKIGSLKLKTSGRLIVKEYPTGGAHSGHFRALLNDLKLKKQFKPQIVFIDYLNICASSRLKGMSGSVNSYSYVKAIAEELRGLGVEFDVPIVSATQTTRSGYGSSDPGLEDTSESFGLPATADLMFALITNEELDKDGQIMVKQLKNRYNDPNFHKRFLIGVNKLHMRLYDLDESAQKEIAQEPVGRVPHINEVRDDPELIKKVAEFQF